MTLDFTRRAVVGGGAVGLVVAGATFSVSPISARVPKMIILEESAIPESRQFARALVNAGHLVRVIPIDRSLNGLFHDMEGTDCCFVGLTSDPAAMIATQLLVERGGHPLLQWTHHYAARSWSHKTAGAPALLSRARSSWPTALAHHVRDNLVGPRRDELAACRSNACGLPDSSPGMLVSWVIAMGEGQ